MDATEQPPPYSKTDDPENQQPSEQPPPQPQPTRRRRRPKVAEPDGPNVVNWLLHWTYTKKDYDTAERIADMQIKASNGQAEYALHIKALICRSRGDINQSLELFQKAMYLNPRNHLNAKQVARSLVLMSRHVAAIDVYDQIVAGGSTDWHVLHNRSICLAHVGRIDDAKDSLRQALALHKHDVSFIELGKLFINEGNTDEAIAIFLEALNYSPENIDIFTTLGLLYLQLEDSRKAFDYFGRALTYNAKDTTAILGVASIFQECDDFDVALIKYRVAVAVSPETPEVWNNIGMCFFGQQKMVAAIACLKHARYLDPFEWKTSFNLGLVHLKTQQYASAFQYLSAAVNLEPNFADSYMLLGTALTYLDDAPNAVIAFKKAVALDSDNPLIHLNFALVLFASEDLIGATERLQHFERLLLSLPKDEQTKEMVATAEKLSMHLALGPNASESQF